MKKHILPLAMIAALGLSACGKHDHTAAGSADAPASSSGQAAQSPNGTVTAAATLPQPNASTPITSYTMLTSGNQLMFLYYALSGMPPDYSQIASAYSQDYRNTTDSFKQHDILQALTPQINAAITAAKSQRYVIWAVNNILIGHYDFNKKAFPLNNGFLQDNAAGNFTDNSGYSILFKNGSAFSTMPVADENVAKNIENRVSLPQGLMFSTNPESMFNLKIYAFAQKADLSNHQIDCVITRVDLIGHNGTVLASYMGK